MKIENHCDPFVLDLAALSAGESGLSPELEAHLEHCADCRALLEAFKGQREMLAGLEDPPGFEPAVFEVQNRVMAQVMASSTQVHRWKPKHLWLAAAACILPLLAAGWFATRARRTAPILIEQISPAPMTTEPIKGISPTAQTVLAASRRSKSHPAVPYDPVRAARRILESSSGMESQTVLIQQSPKVVIYWVKPYKETSHES